MQVRYQLLKAGEYDAVIIRSADRISESSGNPMMDMTLTVFDNEGKEHEIRDFLVFTPKMMWKVIHFADSAGLLTEYEAGKLCSAVALNRRLRVKIKIEEGSLIPENKLKNKLIGSKYPDKNKIDDYIKLSDKQEPVLENHHDLNDTIPF